MEPKELLIYELPLAAEVVSIGFIQTLIAKYYARKVNRKYKRYQYRKERERFFTTLSN